ncbi:hypothetical protein B0O80DRAFT_503475 [Mortierella sp. GBAus27b]|nr:hypothetical protein B0O80DRAFT_503475 [Mortierella sp. GBAus27b]
MEYITIAFVAAGAYLMYTNMVEPRLQVQRAFLAEEARKELVRIEDERLAKRGSHKQPKKQSVVRGRQRKNEQLKEDGDGLREFSQKVAITNSFGVLDTMDTIAPATSIATGHTIQVSAKTSGKTKGRKVISTKGSFGKDNEDAISSPSPALAPMKEQGFPQKEQHGGGGTQTKKSVKFDLIPHIQEEIKPIRKKERRVTNNTTTTSQVVCSKEFMQEEDLTSEAKARIEPQRIERTSQRRQHDKINDEDDFKLVRKVSKRVSNPVVPVIEVVEKTVDEVVPMGDIVSIKELEGLHAILKAKELALSTAEARVEKAHRMIQSLQNQIKVDAELVKSAKKTASRAQNAEAKLESFSYTNSHLVRQLLQEQDYLKTVQMQALKDSAAENLKSQQVSSRVLELEAQMAILEQERVQLATEVDRLQKLDQDSRTEVPQLSTSLKAADDKMDPVVTEVLSDDTGIAPLEVSLDRIRALEAENVSLKEAIDQWGVRLMAKDEEIDRLVDELFIARVRQSKALDSAENLSPTVGSLDAQDLEDVDEKICTQANPVAQLNMDLEVSGLKVSFPADCPNDPDTLLGEVQSLNWTMVAI